MQRAVKGARRTIRDSGRKRIECHTRAVAMVMHTNQDTDESPAFGLTTRRTLIALISVLTGRRDEWP